MIPLRYILTCVLIAIISVVVVVFAPSMDFDADSASTSENVELDNTTYYPSNDTGYHLVNKASSLKLSDNLVSFGMTVTSNGSYGDSSKDLLEVTDYNGYKAYGVSGSSVYFTIQANYKLNEHGALDNAWNLTKDSWNGSVLGIGSIGTIGTGAVLVRTSLDGINWTTNQNGKYNHGWFSTDFANNYTNSHNIPVELYRPDASSLQRGIYVEISYLYEMDNGGYETVKDYLFGWDWLGIETGSHKEYKADYWVNVVETTRFFVIANDPDAVTFRNLTENNNPSVVIEGLTAQELTSLETMRSGSVTSTGFQINVEKNPYLIVLITKDGITISLNDDVSGRSHNTIYREDGLYSIEVMSKLGQVKNVELYVNKQSVEEIKTIYFGESILRGAERHLIDGNYPTFKTGLSIGILPLSTGMSPMGGTIFNQYTAETIEVPFGSGGIDIVLDKEGFYLVTLYNNGTFLTDDPSGDCWIFTYQFQLIDDDVVPKINKMNLTQYNVLNYSNLRSGCWGVDYPTGGDGIVTVLYADRSRAIDAAVQLFREDVVSVGDSGWMYSGDLLNDHSVYGSTHEISKMLNESAGVYVHEVVLDMSDSSTYRTLSVDRIEELGDLRKAPIYMDVRVYADENERSILTSNGSGMIISSIPFNYLEYDTSGKLIVERKGFNDFVFISDENGYDSVSVVVVSSDGKQLKLEYGVSAGEQLNKASFPSGPVKVVETNVYGYEATYDCFFIKAEDVLAGYSITTNNGDYSETLRLDQNMNGGKIVTDSFTITSEADEIYDYLNPVITVSKNGNVIHRSVMSEDLMFSMDQSGTYVISCSNCIGASFLFEVEIQQEGLGKYVDVLMNNWWIVAIISLIFFIVLGLVRFL